jgi:hypothetical protein
MAGAGRKGRMHDILDIGQGGLAASRRKAAQLGPLHGDVIHVLGLGGLAALTAWVSRPRRG